MFGKFKTLIGEKRTIFEVILMLVVVPALIFIGFYFLGDEYYYLTACLVLLVPILSYFINFEKQGLNVQHFVIITVFIALTVVTRAAFFAIPQFKPILALVIISGICLGSRDAFLIGAMSAFVSNFIFGQGPWTIWQMFSLGFIGFLSGLIFFKRVDLNKNKNLIFVSIFGLISTFVYSAINNFGFLLMAKTPLSIKAFISASAMSFTMDLTLAVATIIFLFLLTKPVNKMLERVKLKFDL